MSPRPLRLIAPALPATRRGQMSCPKTFVSLADHRRARVRVEAPREMSREEFLRFWSGLMLRRCGSAAAVARVFVTTEQTGRNWIDGAACPTGLTVMRALEMWPAEFAQVQRRVA